MMSWSTCPNVQTVIIKRTRANDIGLSIWTWQCDRTRVQRANKVICDCCPWQFIWLEKAPVRSVSNWFMLHVRVSSGHSVIWKWMKKSKSLRNKWLKDLVDQLHSHSRKTMIPDFWSVMLNHHIHFWTKSMFDATLWPEEGVGQCLEHVRNC